MSELDIEINNVMKLLLLNLPNKSFFYDIISQDCVDYFKKHGIFITQKYWGKNIIEWDFI